MANEDDGWDELEREFCKVKNDVATPANGSKPLSASEQAKLIDKFASEIRSLWYRSVKEILDMAKACAAADRQLGPKQRKILVEKLPFGESAFSKLVQIGKDLHIRDIIKWLPPSYSTIYLVSQMSKQQRESGIEAGVIHADATREDIENFRAGDRSSPKADPRSEPERRSAKANKAQESAGRSEQKTSDADEDFDFSLDDDEDSSEDDQNGSEPSAESDDVYDSVVAEWKKVGLRRSTWRATPENVRQKFIEEVLRPEPFKPPAAPAK
jgi:hypothetical protein